MISFVERGHGALFLSLLLALGLALPARALPPDPGTTGPWAVGHTLYAAVDPSRADRTLPVNLWYPVDAENASGDATFYELLSIVGISFGITSEVAIESAGITSRQYLPLVLFSHGFGGIGIQSIKLMETLASHGFVVLSPDHVGNSTFDTSEDVPYEDAATDRPKDISFLIDHLLARSADPDDELFEHIHPLAIGVVGHSFGGFTALAMAAGYAASAFGAVPPDARVRAIVPISGVAGLHSDAELAAIHVPMLLLGGTLDTSVPIVPNATRPFDLASSRAVYRADVVGATHTHFANICDIAQVLFDAGIGIRSWPAIGAAALVAPYNQTCVPPAYPIDEAVRLENLYTVAFFKRRLQGNRNYDSFLTAAYADANEPDIHFFDGSDPVPPPNPPLCGIGSELALALPLLSLAASRRRAEPSPTSLRSGLSS